jgi:hypothetical protein
MGPLPIPARTYDGVQTARSLLNFPFPSSGPAARMPRQIVDAQALVKKCAARYNVGAGELAREKGEAIIRAADEVIGGSDAVPDSQFPLAMYQTGSGTQVRSPPPTHTPPGGAKGLGEREKQAERGARPSEEPGCAPPPQYKRPCAPLPMGRTS